MIISKKYLNQIIYNNIKQVITSFINLCFPFLIIFKEGKSVWGNFVELYLYIFLISAIVMWGNRNDLLRKFSSSPKDIAKDFTISLVTRFYLFLVLSLLGFLMFSKETAFFLVVCHLGIFLSSSFEVLAIYKKDFLINLYLEVICFFILVVGIITYPLKMTTQDILVIYSCYRFLKGLLFLSLYRTFLQFGQFSSHWKVLKDSFPFFLLTLFGFLGTRIDVYIFQNFSSAERLAEYHILNNLILFLITMANQILTPFTKNFYRGSKKFITDIKKKVAIFGLVVVLLGIPTIGMFLFLVLDIELSVFSSIMIFFGIYPTFLYSVDIMNLLKNKKDYYILILTIIFSIINACLSYVFLKFGWEIEGVLLSCAIAQVFTLIIYKLDSIKSLFTAYSETKLKTKDYSSK